MNGERPRGTPVTDPSLTRGRALTGDPVGHEDLAQVEVPVGLRREIEKAMKKYPETRSASIPALWAVQRHHGWCSPEAVDQAACVMRVTPAYLDAVATFYDMLETEPKPPHDVYVCTNISCSLLGARDFLAAMQEAADESFNVRAFECLGACDIAPMASVDGVYVGPLEPSDAQVIVHDVKAGRSVLEDKQLARRPVADEEARGPS